MWRGAAACIPGRPNPGINPSAFRGSMWERDSHCRFDKLSVAAWELPMKFAW